MKGSLKITVGIFVLGFVDDDAPLHAFIVDL